MILVAAPDAGSLARARALAPPGARWLFVGTDARIASRVERVAQCAVCRVEPAALDHAAEALRDAYLQYIAVLSEGRRDIDWWGSSVPEKNPFVSRAFHRAVWLRAAIDAVAGNGDAQVVVVPDAPLRDAIAANLPSAAVVPPSWRHFRRAAARLEDWTTLLVRRSYFLVRTLARHALGRALGARSSVLASRLRDSPLTLIQIWVDRRSFAPDGRFRYFVDFAGVADYCRRAGRTVATLPFVVRGVSFRMALRAMMREEPRLLVAEAWLLPSDIFHAAVRLRRWERGPFPRFAGLEISAILADDVRRERFRHRFSENVLLAFLVARLQLAGFRIERFIHTCENHTWERIIRRAFRQHFPAAVLVGYQAPVLSRFRLNEFVSASEFDLAPMPDYIVSYGPYAASLLAASGYPPDRVRVGAAPRYAHLLDGSAAERHPERGCRVVVAFSIDEQEDAELLTVTRDAFAGESDVEVLLKPHPSVPFERILRRVGWRRLPSHFTVTEESIVSACGRSVALVYGTSGVCLEAPSQGAVPIHVYLTSCLDADPLEWADDVRATAYTPDDLRRIVRAAVAPHADPVRVADRWRQKLVSHFGAVTDAAYHEFLSDRPATSMAPAVRSAGRAI